MFGKIFSIAVYSVNVISFLLFIGTLSYRILL